MNRKSFTTACCGMAALAAVGATVTWQGGDGDWSVASNWGGTKPNYADWAVVSDPSTVTVTTVEEDRVFINLSGGATLVMQDGGMLSLAAGDKVFGIASEANGTASVLMNGGAFDIYGNPHIGQYGTGLLRQTGGTIRCAGYFSVGRYAGSVGTAIIEGGELIKCSLGDAVCSILVGEEGEGTLVVKDGGTVRVAANVAAINSAIPGGIQIAYRASATGTVRLEPGGTIISPRTFARNANGTFVFAGGVLKAPEDADSCVQFLEQVGGAGTVSVETAGAFVEVPPGVVATISASVVPTSGSDGGFVKLGEGSLVLTGTNSWAGMTIVSNGTLVAEAPFALPGYDSPNRIRVENGAVLATGAGWTAAEIAVLRANMIGTPSVAIDTTSGDVTLASNENYAYGMSKVGTGTLYLTGQNSMGGDVSVLKGTLQADFGQGLDAGHAVVLNGGTLSSASGSITAGLGTGAGQIAIVPGSSSGFSAKGVPLTVNLGGAGETLSYGTSAFNPMPLLLNGAEADQPLTFANGLGYTWLTIRVDRASVALTGPMTGDASGALAKIGAGELVFSGNEDCHLGWLDHRFGTIRIERPMSLAGKIGVFNNVQLFVRDSLETGMDFWQEAGALTQIETGGTLEASGVIAVKAGLFRQNGGIVRSLSSGESAVGGYDDNAGGKSAVAVYEMNGGLLDARSNFQVGRYGTGTFEQNGGEILIAGWPCVGRFDTGVGTFRHHGGTFSQTGSGCGYVVGELGLGLVEIDGTAEVSVAGKYGLYYLPRARGKSGELHLNGGTLSVRCITPTTYGTNRTFRLDGGTLKTTESTATFVKTGTLTKFEVGAAGGTVDTCGNDVTFNQPLTARSGVDAMEPPVHRWGFNGTLEDSIGTANASTNGTVNLGAETFSIPGGARGAGAVNLGRGLVPTGDAGFTIEVWARQDAVFNWSRVFDIGTEAANSFLLAWTSGTATDRTTLSVKYGGVQVYKTNVLGGFQTRTDYHIAVTAVPKEDGNWQVTSYKQNADTGDTLATFSLTPNTGWSPANQVADNFWLGRSLSGNDMDAAATYDEVRIWDRPLTEAQLGELARLGPNSWRFGGTFKKRGAGTLTLTGANTFAVPTEIEGGTLALAAGASMVSDVLVKTGGVFAVAATATPPSVAIEIGENGACGYVMPTSGVLDLGTLTLSLANPEALANGRAYVICRSQGGFTGTPSVTGVPSSWQVNVIQSNGEVRLAKSGVTIIFR